MLSPKKRIDNIKSAIKQAERLLNQNDKKSEAYQKISTEIAGLKAALRVAEASLKTEKNIIKDKIKKAKTLKRNARTDRDATTVQIVINNLLDELKDLDN